eukprot:1161189-Pelagomonas_calceolata.AAC.6
MRKCTEQESPVAIGVVALLESFVHLLQQPLHLIQNAACNCQWVITAEGVLHSKLVKPADAVSASEMKHPLWAQPQTSHCALHCTDWMDLGVAMQGSHNETMELKPWKVTTP